MLIEDQVLGKLKRSFELEHNFATDTKLFDRAYKKAACVSL